MTLQAVAEKDREHLDERFDRIENQIEGIKGAWNKILWVVVGLVVAAFVKFMLDGV